MSRRSEPTHNTGGYTQDDPLDGFSGVVADLALAVGQLREDRKSSPKPSIAWADCHPVPVAIGQPVPLSAGAGTLGLTQDLFGPNDPYWWDLRRLSAWGWTAGTVTVYLNQIGGEQLAVFPTPGEWTWGAQKLLGPRDSIIWQAAGITGTVNVAGQAVEITSQWVPQYLM